MCWGDFWIFGFFWCLGEDVTAGLPLCESPQGLLGIGVPDLGKEEKSAGSGFQGDTAPLGAGNRCLGAAFGGVSGTSDCSGVSGLEGRGGLRLSLAPANNPVTLGGGGHRSVRGAQAGQTLLMSVARQGV